MATLAEGRPSLHDDAAVRQVSFWFVRLVCLSRLLVSGQISHGWVDALDRVFPRTLWDPAESKSTVERRESEIKSANKERARTADGMTIFRLLHRRAVSRTIRSFSFDLLEP